MPECPSIEPRLDYVAQLKDLDDKRSRREAVWFSPLNAQYHYLLWLAYPRDRLIVNFDGLGGVLVTKSPEITDRLIAEATTGKNVYSIIGEAIGAGSGKPPVSDEAVAVQQLLLNGAVVRETIVPDIRTARALKARWKTKSRPARIVTLKQALDRRVSLLSAENSHR